MINAYQNLLITALQNNFEQADWYFNNLSPYKKYKDVQGVNINELVKQSYLFNGIEAYAWKGIVWLSQSTFRTYGEGNDFLICTIGHELAHVIFNDHIEQDINLSNKVNEFLNFCKLFVLS